jgi:predicted enzyme related to lactoylglutathione lyase
MSQHPVVHIEISAKDTVAAGKFYSDLFGWKVEQVPQMHYATFQAEGGPGGGFNAVTETNPAGTVMFYILSDDIEADLAKVVRLGGQALVQKTEIPGMGWFGVFKDPTGNTIGLYTGTLVG